MLTLAYGEIPSSAKHSVSPLFILEDSVPHLFYLVCAFLLSKIPFATLQFINTSLGLRFSLFCAINVVLARWIRAGSGVQAALSPAAADLDCLNGPAIAAPPAAPSFLHL